MDEIKITAGGRTVEATYTIFSKKENGVYSTLIPAFNLAFVSPDQESLLERSDFMVKNWISYLLEDKSIKHFVLEVHKLGFRSARKHNLVLTNFINGKGRSASLKADVNDMEGYKSQKASQLLAA